MQELQLDGEDLERHVQHPQYLVLAKRLLLDQLLP